jgi:hypothetical protein
MRPCIGIPRVCGPLCAYKDLKDGTYTIADVLLFNMTLDEIEDALNNG